MLEIAISCQFSATKKFLHSHHHRLCFCRLQCMSWTSSLAYVKLFCFLYDIFQMKGLYASRKKQQRLVGNKKNSENWWKSEKDARKPLFWRQSKKKCVCLNVFNKKRCFLPQKVYLRKQNLKHLTKQVTPNERIWILKFQQHVYKVGYQFFCKGSSQIYKL